MCLLNVNIVISRASIIHFTVLNETSSQLRDGWYVADLQMVMISWKN